MILVFDNQDVLTITPELLSALPTTSLVEMLLHRSNLFTAATSARVVNKIYTNNIQEEIKAIHDELKKRR